MLNLSDLFEQFSDQLLKMFDIKISGNTFSGTHTQFKIREEYSRAVKCAEYDPSFLTSLTILEKVYCDAISKISYPLSIIMEPDEVLTAQIKSASTLNELLLNQEYQRQKKHFLDTVNKGIEHYGAFHEIEDSEVFTVRYKSINSFKLLNQNQFLKGNFSDLSPQYIKQIYEWWNINSLLNFALTLPNSISLHIIRNPNFYESFFCILIKNGSNVYTLTDGIESSNPLYMQRSRRPDRSMAKSIEKHLFPYYLLNLDAESGELFTYEDDENSNAIVAFQKETHIVTTLDKLEVNNLAWLILLFDLIHQNYFINQKQLPALSYTNEMMRHPERYLALAESNGLEVDQNSDGFNDLTVESLHTKNVDHSALGSDVTTNWMEDRYASKIDPNLLNIYSKIEDEFTLDLKTQSLTNEKFEPNIFSKNESKLSVKSVIASDFGTAEQLTKDRIFIARHNYANIISQMAENEYKDSRSKLEKWFIGLCTDHSDKILKQCAETAAIYDYDSKSVKLRRESIENLSGLGYMNGFPTITNLGVMGLRGDIAKNTYLYPLFTMAQAKSEAYGADKNCCYLNNTLATYEFAFKMRDAKMISEFFNIKTEDMPELLQFFTTNKYFSHSNSILNRVDPMAVIVNPLANLSLTILVRLSIKGLKEVIAEYQTQSV